MLAGLNHRYTRAENPGEGVKAFRKNYQWGPPILGFIAFILTSVLKFA
jgi:hypothetical protein